MGEEAAAVLVIPQWDSNAASREVTASSSSRRGSIALPVMMIYIYMLFISCLFDRECVDGSSSRFYSLQLILEFGAVLIICDE